MVPSSILKSFSSWAAVVVLRWAHRSTAPLWRLMMMLSVFSMILKVTRSRYAGVPQ